MKPRAALLDKNGKVIGEVFNAPAGNTIEIAGTFTSDGYPVNIKPYKISRSKKNLEKARYEQPVLKVQVKENWAVWTFFAVENNTVVY